MQRKSCLTKIRNEVMVLVTQHEFALFIQTLPYYVCTTDWKEAERIVVSGQHDYINYKMLKHGCYLHPELAILHRND